MNMFFLTFANFMFYYICQKKVSLSKSSFFKLCLM